MYYVLLDGDETEIGENGINLSGKKNHSKFQMFYSKIICRI